MPVTAKFSKDFYDRLGHEVVDELVQYLNMVDATYRSELKEINELHFARFDAKLEQRAAELGAKIDALKTHTDDRLDGTLSRLEGRMTALIEKTRADMIKWMFVVVTAGVLAIRFG